MEAASTVPQVAKKEYRNNTSGWVGVVTLDHTGAEQGVNIEPNGTIWLSDAEAILTARAPRRPEDNPFLERTYVMQDPQTGVKREVKMRPVTLVSDRSKDMYASDRYVPGIVSDNEARAGVTRAARDGTDGPRTAATAAKEAEVVSGADAEVLGGPAMRQEPDRPTQLEPVPPSTGAPAPPETPPPSSPPAAAVPPMGVGQPGLQGAPGAASASDEAESWTEEPEAPGQVLRGSLTGDDGPGQDQGDPTLPAAGDAVHAPVQGAPETVGAALGAEEHAQAQTEEHAQRVDPNVGEETGAARPPTQPQPEGEFAAREEVGSPDAPAADDESAGLIGG